MIVTLCKRFYNRIFLSKELTERGQDAKEYAYKVGTTGAEPVTYKEIMLEEELNKYKLTGLEREKWFCKLYISLSEF
jgi:hypothetical protein